MKETIIVALGDSVTNGVRSGEVDEEDTFRHLVQTELSRLTGQKFKVINASVNGDITTTALLRLQGDVLVHKPDYVTVMFGVNDAGYYRPDTDSMADTPRVSEEEFRKNIEIIIDEIQKSGAIPIMLTPLPMNEFYPHRDFPAYVQNGLNYLVDRYANVIREICSKRGLHLVDLNKIFASDPNTSRLVPDGIHPNKCGHRFIADILISYFLEEILKKSS